MDNSSGTNRQPGSTTEGNENDAAQEQAPASDASASQPAPSQPDAGQSASESSSSAAAESQASPEPAVMVAAEEEQTTDTEQAVSELTAIAEAAVEPKPIQAEVEQVDLDDPKSVELSAEFVGQWSRLISTTNWEKGKIIATWRDALMGSEAPAAAYSDEAWSRRVGGVSPQHVGRLRRVSERFGADYPTYEGVYWSHFLAALDWDDAEMWLEGAVQSKWSVSQMRRTRWESMGSQPADKPAETDVVAASADEDYTPLSESDEEQAAADGTRVVAEGPRADGPDFGDEDSTVANADAATATDDNDVAWEDDEGEKESPFAKIPSLPVDMAEAVEQFKLAIIRHRASEWGEVSQADVGKALDALRAFTDL